MDKRVLLSLTGALGLALLSGCSGPAPIPEPTVPPSFTTASVPPSATIIACPEVAPVEVPGIDQGSEAQHAADLLAAYSDWANAGTKAVADDPAWRSADLPAHCLPDLAKANEEAFVGKLFVTRDDAAWDKYYAKREAINLANLRIAQTTGAETTTGFELQQMLEYSHTDSGSFVKFTAVYRPGSVGGDRLDRWYAAMVPWDGAMIVDYIEAEKQETGDSRP